MINRHSCDRINFHFTQSEPATKEAIGAVVALICVALVRAREITHIADVEGRHYQIHLPDGQQNLWTISHGMGCILKQIGCPPWQVEDYGFQLLVYKIVSEHRIPYEGRDIWHEGNAGSFYVLQ